MGPKSIAVVSAMLAASLAAITASAPAANATSPVVRLADKSPVRVLGNGFAKRELVAVRVVLMGERQPSKVVRASSAGRFNVVFAEQVILECDQYTISAVGRRGSRASLRDLIPPPGCGIAPQP
jgi:hypothetical protein